ncbi:hypothetical protein BH24PSE2_BH24PSE2_20700 [soil metagenome]
MSAPDGSSVTSGFALRDQHVIDDVSETDIAEVHGHVRGKKGDRAEGRSGGCRSAGGDKCRLASKLGLGVGFGDELDGLAVPALQRCQGAAMAICEQLEVAVIGEGCPARRQKRVRVLPQNKA